jgi:Tol biopolymer transport system component
MSADGRYVAFVGHGLDHSYPSGMENVYVRDRFSGTTKLVSAPEDGVTAYWGAQHGPSISSDGRYVAFTSQTSLIVEDTHAYDVYLFDQQLNSLEMISVASDGSEGVGVTWPNYLDSYSYAPSVSANGQFVAFASMATNFAEDDTNGVPDIFVRDRQNGTTERVSFEVNGLQRYTSSSEPHISDDGRYVAYHSGGGIYLYDRQNGITKFIAIGIDSDISDDNSSIVFISTSNSLVANDTNNVCDVFVYDLQSEVIERVSVATDGTEASGLYSVYNAPSISADGRFVSFTSSADNLVSKDTNMAQDVFVHDRLRNTTELVSLSDSNAMAGNSSYESAMDASGFLVVFRSSAALTSDDVSSQSDIFLRDRNSIEIVTATYRSNKNDLTVEATSNLEEDAGLVLDGYGPMTFSKGKWSLVVNPAGGNPGTVSVTGIEGTEVVVVQ